MNDGRIWVFSVIWNFFCGTQIWQSPVPYMLKQHKWAHSFPPLPVTYFGALQCRPHLAGALPSSLEDQSLQVTEGSETACTLFWVDSGNTTKRTLMRISILRKVHGQHAAAPLVQRELKSGGCVGFPPGVQWPSSHHSRSEPQSVNPLLSPVTSRRVWIFWTFSQNLISFYFC